MKGLKYNIKDGDGKFNFLDKAYNKFINDSLRNCDDDDNIERWEVYNALMQELLILGKKEYFAEAKYRMTGNEDPNKVMLDLISKDEETKGLLSNYKNRIIYFMDCDLINHFTK